MTIEVATYIADLQPVNPPSVDPVSQGDDHLRLIKQVLQNTFPGLSRAWYQPNAAAKSADFTVVAADQNKTFLIDTTAGVVNMTLPSLAAGDAGWNCFHIKTTLGVNPVMVKPPSGTLTSGALTGLSAARRSIPGARICSLWTGTAWYVNRAEGVAGPVGACIEYHGASLPFGFEWPSGQTLASVATAYPEYNAVFGSGVTLDKRARLGVPLDNLGGSAAGRLAGGIITGTAIGNTGGTDTRTLVTTNLPAYTPSGSVATTTNITQNAQANNSGSGTPGPFTAPIPSPAAATITAASTSTFTGTAQGGASTAFGILQPSIMVAQLLVVE